MGAISLLISLICGLSAAVSMIYMLMFVVGITILRSLAPDEYSDLLNQLVSIDHQPSWNKLSIPFLHSVPALNNTLLVCLFGLQHSAMQRGPLKSLLSSLISESLQKSLYVLCSSLCLFNMYLFWIPMPTVIWDITNPALRPVVYALMLFALGGMTFSMQNLNPIRLLGISTHLKKLFGQKNHKEKKVEKKRLVTSGIYSLVRHPVYTFSLMMLWVTPHLTVGHLLLSSLLTTYVVCSVALFEEPDLIKEFGQDYVEYMKTTPGYVPRIPWLFSKDKKG